MRSLIAQFVKYLSPRLYRVLYPMLLLAVLTGSARAQATVANALGEVNRVRVARGLYPLTPCVVCQAQAEAESTWRAARRMSGHYPNGCKPGNAEGVGWSGGRDPYGQRFHTCFHSPGGGGGGRRFFGRLVNRGPDFTTTYRYAGAAAAVSPSGETYYTLILR